MIIRFREPSNTFFADRDLYYGLSEEERRYLTYERQRCREATLSLVWTVAAAAGIGFALYCQNTVVALALAAAILFAKIVHYGMND